MTVISALDFKKKELPDSNQDVVNLGEAASVDLRDGGKLLPIASFSFISSKMLQLLHCCRVDCHANMLK